MITMRNINYKKNGLKVGFDRQIATEKKFERVFTINRRKKEK